MNSIDQWQSIILTPGYIIAFMVGLLMIFSGASVRLRDAMDKGMVPTNFHTFHASRFTSTDKWNDGVSYYASFLFVVYFALCLGGPQVLQMLGLTITDQPGAPSSGAPASQISSIGYLWPVAAAVALLGLSRGEHVLFAPIEQFFRARAHAVAEVPDYLFDIRERLREQVNGQLGDDKSLPAKIRKLGEIYIDMKTSGHIDAGVLYNQAVLQGITRPVGDDASDVDLADSYNDNLLAVAYALTVNKTSNDIDNILQPKRRSVPDIPSTVFIIGALFSACVFGALAVSIFIDEADSLPLMFAVALYYYGITGTITYLDWRIRARKSAFSCLGDTGKFVFGSLLQVLPWIILGAMAFSMKFGEHVLIGLVAICAQSAIAVTFMALHLTTFWHRWQNFLLALLHALLASGIAFAAASYQRHFEQQRGLAEFKSHTTAILALGLNEGLRDPRPQAKQGQGVERLVAALEGLLSGAKPAKSDHDVKNLIDLLRKGNLNYEPGNKLAVAVNKVIEINEAPTSKSADKNFIKEALYAISISAETKRTGHITSLYKLAQEVHKDKSQSDNILEIASKVEEAGLRHIEFVNESEAKAAEQGIGMGWLVPMHPPYTALATAADNLKRAYEGTRDNSQPLTALVVAGFFSLSFSVACILIGTHCRQCLVDTRSQSDVKRCCPGAGPAACKGGR